MRPLCIEGELTIYSAAAQKEALMAYLASGDELELNLAQVSEMDTAGLQLLVLAKREAGRAQKTLRYTMHSPAVLEVLELSRMDAVFGDQAVLAGLD